MQNTPETPSGKPIPEAMDAQPVPAENPMIKKRWFGRGIYGSKDVPIRVLDACIGVMIAAAVILMLWGAMHPGFSIKFDTGIQDVTVEAQKVKHGEKLTEPQAPLRPGYTLVGWSTTPEPDVNLWNFTANAVENEFTLYAVWQPDDGIVVKFDLNGGTVDGRTEVDPIRVTFGEAYGELPTPAREGAEFVGWQYSDKIITAETPVLMTGEHILTATWK